MDMIEDMDEDEMGGLDHYAQGYAGENTDRLGMMDRNFLGGQMFSDGFNYRNNLNAFEDNRIANLSKSPFLSFHHNIVQEVMPEKVDTDKPFILYLDSLNKVNQTNMQCLR